MLVEDEPVVAIGIRSMMQECGHEIVGIAKNSDEAFDICRSLNPEIAVMDIKLPGMNGIEITRRIVDEFNIATIILTAYSNEQYIEGAASAGAYTYLLKPVTKEALSANIEVCVARWKAFCEIKKEASDAIVALENRKLAERAKHVLMERLSLSEADAFNHMRQKCRNQNKTIRQTAEEILAADEKFILSIDKESPKKIKNHSEK